MTGKLDCCGLTDVGCVRANNEDQFLIADLTKSMRVHQTSLSLNDDERLFGGSQGKLFLVADGMGGHAGGERASQLTLETITNYMLNTMPWFFRLDEQHEEDYRHELQQALSRCQERIELTVQAQPRFREMGTTLTMAFLLWPRLYVVHVGDSRCYLFRQTKLRQITTDHTVAQQFVDAGGFQAEQLENTIWANTLWNFIGGNRATLDPEVQKARLQVGDALLLCTDGLTKHVSEDFIAQILATDGSASDMCSALLNEAKNEGGSDNITVIVGCFRYAGSTEDEAQNEEMIRQPFPDPIADTLPMIPTTSVEATCIDAGAV